MRNLKAGHTGGLDTAMTNDEFRICETILTIYPDVCLSADIRRELLMSRALRHDPGDHVQGGPGINPADRYVSAVCDDRALKDMQMIMTRVESGFGKLRAEERDFVRRYYFAGANDWDAMPQLIYKSRRRVCGKIFFVVIGAYDAVRRYRDRERERRINATKKAPV